MFQRVSNGFLAGILVAAATITALVVTDTRVNREESHAAADVPTEEAARAFIADWRHMREGTWVVDSGFVRVLSDGRSFRGDIHEAQKPPQRVRTTFGTTTIDVPGKTIVCAQKTDQVPGACRTTVNEKSYEQFVADDVATVERLVLGSPPSYGVIRVDSDCYRLQSIAAKSTSNWGELAIFCFDNATGALQRSEIRRGTATDTVTSTGIRKNVADSEFVPPANA